MMLRLPEFSSVFLTMSSSSRRLANCCWIACALLAIAVPVRAQTSDLDATPAEPAEAETETAPAEPLAEDAVRPLEEADSILSLEGGERLLAEASDAVDAEDYDLAEEKLNNARRVFNQLSNFYQELTASFQGVDIRISREQQQKAVRSAQMRDRATYQLALVHRAKSEPELAVPLLIQVIRSQNPTTELGQKAYQQLFDLGFVESQFPPGGPPPQTEAETIEETEAGEADE